MDGSCLSSDQVIAELIGMGFEFTDATEAIKSVGPSLEDAVDFILNGSRINSTVASTTSKCSTINEKSLGKRALSTSRSSDRMRQSTIIEHLQSAGRPKRKKTYIKSGVSVSGSQVLSKLAEGSREPLKTVESNLETIPEVFTVPSLCQEELDTGPGWEQKVSNLLIKHFGFSSLKSFQKEALTAWSAHQDCLVLAATGSGKSLCFQIPALLTGKVVVVISPLISLMNDQCLKLAKHNVSACFLGSGQTDSSIEQKAMRGMYDIIYVCPETILRRIKPLQSLAECRGIALFAIDEVHCISKWGHDFRPDYRRLSILRENFRADSLKFLRFDIPLMALTATATLRVREDILTSLCMSSKSKIVLTSFFRPNLRFSVKHSRTSSPKSYEKDFRELINIYTMKKRSGKSMHGVMLQDIQHEPASSDNTSTRSRFEADRMSQSDPDSMEDDSFSENGDDFSSTNANWTAASNEKKLSVDFLEDECDLSLGGDDLDVSCGEFFGKAPDKVSHICGSPEIDELPNEQDERFKLQQGHLGGPTIVYVPTRKETLSIAKFFCSYGVKAAAYNAKLPKPHLRQVHLEFHENALEVVVATIAFGMGIDKSNVRRIIHYGWPQSLEAYYQEAGRAGRDGKLADCILYANLTRIPSLLPSPRSKDQTKQAYKMLSDCFRYGMKTTGCRAKTLVEYFGEEFSPEKCQMCDICVNGPPEMLNLKGEAHAFMHVIAAHYGQVSIAGSSHDNALSVGNMQGTYIGKPNIRMFVSRIREQFQNFAASDRLLWQGLARALEDQGFIQEGDDTVHVQIKFPHPTKLGLEFLQHQKEEPFCIHPEADMLLSMRNDIPYSSFSEWGKGWADPEIRRQRLERKGVRRNPRQRKSRKPRPDPKTVRGRLAAKLTKKK